MYQKLRLPGHGGEEISHFSLRFFSSQVGRLNRNTTDIYAGRINIRKLFVLQIAAQLDPVEHSFHRISSGNYFAILAQLAALNNSLVNIQTVKASISTEVSVMRLTSSAACLSSRTK